MAIDPVCGMYVSEDTDLYLDKDGTRYYFCSTGCLEKFREPEREEKSLKIRLIIAWSFSIPILILNYALVSPYRNYILLLLALPVQFYSGLGFYHGAYGAIKNRSGNMDLLITLGTLTAFIFSLFITFDGNVFPVKYTYYDASVFIITLILTGGYIESLTKRAANSSAHRLLELIPESVHMYSNGNVHDVAYENIKTGDAILIRPGENIAVDGTIIKGTTEVDESMITGEQMPVLKHENDNVYSGTKNINGSIIVKVNAVGPNSTVNKLYSLIQMAAMGRAKIQRIADVFSSYFVPVVISAALGSSIFWFIYLNHDGDPISLIISVLVFVSVIVIACPCAIGLAAPITLLISSNESLENGIIIKNSSSMDRLSHINMVIFDKTGTLTNNSPNVSYMRYYGDKMLVNSMLISIEQASNHPAARAIVNYIKELPHDTYTINDIKEIPGFGIKGAFNGREISVTRDGNFTVLNYNNEKLAEIKIEYKLRDSAKIAVKKLIKNGIDVAIVTGDSKENTVNIAHDLDINKYYYNIKPDQKAEIVKKMQRDGKYVMFVGDGINDTIAMEAADVGVSMSSGSDITKENGDIILLKDDLKNVYNMIIIGRKTIKKVRQNIGWAIGYNSALIPVAAGILVPLFGLSIYFVLPILAALAMGMSSTTVVLNSLRIKKSIRRSISL
ncbi:heavy metal translocating P-type ATPase [Acidiplasma sp.]|uniref:heavy metal translocating P-type ATPase n=1 Tax=Acidiplasma sp. TaxID=1872114 RepID=UPI00258FFDA4|nr:heavy metal translocating P-type ATPase [Acidiplasma sp.]